MIKFENIVLPSAEQWTAIILGARNPLNSWRRSDSYIGCDGSACNDCCNLKFGERCAEEYQNCIIGPNDLDLMKRLAASGPVHAKYRRMITVIVTITAPLYWWKEFDTYRVGVEKNSCSTMHKIADKEFTLEDFSCEHLLNVDSMDWGSDDVCCSAAWPSGVVELPGGDISNVPFMPMDILQLTIKSLNRCREAYLMNDAELKKVQDSFRVGFLDMKEKREKMNRLREKKKQYWWQMIQLLPSSYNQRRTIMLNYEVLAHIYQDRKEHKLDEWGEHKPVNITNGGKVVRTIPNQHQGFCDWIKTLPYNELITGNFKED